MPLVPSVERTTYGTSISIWQVVFFFGPSTRVYLPAGTSIQFIPTTLVGSVRISTMTGRRNTHISVDHEAQRIHNVTLECWYDSPE